MGLTILAIAVAGFNASGPDAAMSTSPRLRPFSRPTRQLRLTRWFLQNPKALPSLASRMAARCGRCEGVIRSIQRELFALVERRFAELSARIDLLSPDAKQQKPFKFAAKRPTSWKHSTCRIRFLAL
jgi:hypothetical protein